MRNVQKKYRENLLGNLHIGTMYAVRLACYSTVAEYYNTVRQ